jgi:hypothetical protein
MTAYVAGFDWDRGNRDKCQLHGVSVAEIEAAFKRPMGVVPDPSHSPNEERFKAIGRTDEGRHLLIVFTLREHDGATRIRPISARYMHRREVEHYEKTIAEIDER